MKLNIDRLLNQTTLRVVCLTIAVAGLSTAFAAKSKPASDDEAPAERPAPRASRAAAGYADVVKKVTPSVVQVYTSTQAKPVRVPGWSDRGEGPLPWFFGPPSGRRGPTDRWQTPPQHGLGSGVIVSKDGYILTNNHVVDEADEVRVVLNDRREFTAKVVGADPQTDLAVLKLNADDLPAMELADSDEIEVGDLVLAIGNPFNIGQTVTSGIVSGKGRGNLGLDYEDFIQTDAAINPGNSGGALVDVDGRLVGLNTAIISRTGGNQGIGFAIPANLAHHVMASLIKDGRVTRGYLGAMIQDLTPALAREFNLKENQGALVGEVKPGGPADRAKLQAGDVITEFNGRKVKGSRDLRLQVAETKPGSTVNLKVVRDGGTKSLQAKVQELPGAPTLAKAASGEKADEGVLNGVTVADLDAQGRRETALPRGLRGAVVTDIDPSSPAAEAGLRPGDVITEINRQPVRTADEAVKLTETTSDKTTLLRVWSNGGSRFVVVDETRNG